MKAKNMLGKAMFGLYLIGLVSLFLLVVYVVCGVWYVCSDAEFYGAIAYIPKWTFLFSPLALLGKVKSIKQIMNGVLD
ncbi:MAG: hypothetical protein COT33_01270 [Candidatus Nealsonbacteria bacterium CG08_land_8_20_14_0_20_38_20]|uniref:Uncharacterized protein n=1 Tax=Candidatus Nealsonbacteria bacterium CG08_land_8_20_14_0_20_38_20 TaxID=1974705 RepID=A0A2H0YM41_9BACT|nr:MAG: hypothetical protein COT33_01270 [Candidatus Nealsonbacteria bacterium CG08_land_8_20_14_0_20_38_20]